MAARGRARVRERSRSSQPTGEDSDNEVDVERPAESTVMSKFYATLLVLPGIILYVYILYIVLANLLYPCSLAPFLPGNSSASGVNTQNTGLGECNRFTCLIHVHI